MLLSFYRQYEWIVNSLYSAFPLQCSQCGQRFTEQNDLDKHLDWHFRKSRRQKERIKKPISRAWFPTLSEWIEAKETPTAQTARTNSIISSLQARQFCCIFFELTI
jgi:uncharacterized C2H2 Zn-finger protein